MIFCYNAKYYHSRKKISMQDNLKLIIWTLVGLIGAWFIAMTINRNIFLHSDVDRSIVGIMAISKTDIADSCGTEYVNSNEVVEYKLNSSGQIMYLCPQGWWPIQKVIAAGTITDEFRSRIAPVMRSKLNRFYPQAAAGTAQTTTQPTLPVNTQPPPDQIATPGEVAPHLQGAVSTTQQPTPAAGPAKPTHDNVNPFIGNPAPAAAK
jgi:hypothetical protein